MVVAVGDWADAGDEEFLIMKPSGRQLESELGCIGSVRVSVRPVLSVRDSKRSNPAGKGGTKAAS